MHKNIHWLLHYYNNNNSKIKVWSPQNYNLSKTCGHFFGFKKKDSLWYTRYVVWYGLVWKLPAQKFNVGSSEFWLSQSNFLLLASVDLKLGKSSIKSLVPHKEAGGGGYKLLAVEKPPNCSFIGQKLFVVEKESAEENHHTTTPECVHGVELFSNWTPQKSLLFCKVLISTTAESLSLSLSF